MARIHFHEFLELVRAPYFRPGARKTLFAQLQDMQLTKDSAAVEFYELLATVKSFAVQSASEEGRPFKFDNRDSDLLNSFRHDQGHVAKAAAFHFFFLAHQETYRGVAQALSEKIELGELMKGQLSISVFGNRSQIEHRQAGAYRPWWDTAVETALELSKLDVVLPVPDLNIVGLIPRRARPVQRLRLKEHFFLACEAPERGFALCVQKFRGQWYQMHRPVPVSKGAVAIPNPNGHELFAEESDDGPCIFVVIFSEAEPAADLPPEKLTEWLSSLTPASGVSLVAAEVVFSL